MPPPRRPRSAFTLIELLVVIAIIAVLAIVVILSLNPAELLRQARDSDRLSNLATLNSALGIFSVDQSPASLGVSSVASLSVPDPSATSTLGDQCQGLGMASTSGNFTYECAASSSYLKTNGTGWLPLNFSAISSGSPFGTLPQDPTNQTSSGLFYTYATNGIQYMVTAVMESVKYLAQIEANPVVTDYPGLAAEGNNLTLSPLWNQSGLVGWWPLTEGAGSTALDQSGNGNNGTWSGNLINGSHYTTGKVGPYAGNFDGSTDYIGLSTSSLQVSNVTIMAWAYTSDTKAVQFIGGYGDNNSNAGYWLGIIVGDGGVTGGVRAVDGHALGASSSTYPYLNQWTQMAMTYNGITQSLYVNGVLAATSTVTSGNIGYSSSSDIAAIGNLTGLSSTRYWDGKIDDLRIYNRALSAAEVQALYNAEK